MTDIREKLLEATAQVFAQQGYLGCTTRRVAHEAGVNEVTLFRHFGSKDVLIREALSHVERTTAAQLPETPIDPEAELFTWAATVHRNLTEQRSLIRRVLGEMVEHPDIAPVVCDGAEGEHACLRRYLEAMRRRGQTTLDFDVDGLTALLLGGLFGDAMMRDMMPSSQPVEAMLREFVRATLAAVGATTTPAQRVA